MDYLFENLGDERFQEFCHSLINKEFPDSQAFPVGQPDGGRDSIAYLPNKNNNEFIVFQVKFVRNPYQIQDSHKWLVDTISGELEKINKLIPKGAKRYYLLTNVRGTAHLDSGSIDKVSDLLKEKISIPSICWWRSDLCGKVDSDPVFKWSFPTILNGQELMNSALFSNLNENKERRESVIRAYIADQYKVDNEVKFRQIDLQNKLFSLFTDVPIRVKKYNVKDKSLRRKLIGLEFLVNKHPIQDLFEERATVGAAAFLLKNKIEKALLEGGPGQGKSTISQYICQVHRVRLLNKVSDLNLLQENTKNVPVRLPFKIDMRHVASWVEQKNPYQESLSDEYFAKNWANSLEAFLIGHIYYHSKIPEFTLSDFIAICKVSPVLFVFDGFDEIATLSIREQVIDFINKGIHRLSENCRSLQVVITSRPAAFSDSIGFSVDQYPHFELADVTPAITKEYVEKWIAASRLDAREASEIRRLVAEKLELPHLRDLAKSPMQLAIFISLLRTRGESLPNKRTALYDSYIELFFNRESEKNTVIRDYRDLIIDIHQYLAWILHSEAELYKNSGIIHIDELKARLNVYLMKEGHQTDITDKLFKVVEERVCALVSRVQGTYEFEVQPLREYFCAKYLYQTAPYSPAGAEKKGSKPDRFDAISRNFYWQNVTRFFSGCFDKGELPMLIQKLKELQDDDLLRYTNYPRILTSQLLSDYVFKQYPIYLRDVVKIIVDGINIGNILNQEGRESNNDPIMLPEECGRDEVVEECFHQLMSFPPSDYASELIALIVNNPSKTVEHWMAYLSSITGDDLTTWFEYAYNLQIIHKIDEKVLAGIIEDDPVEQVKRLQILVNGNRVDVIDKNKKIKGLVFRGIVHGNLYMQPQRGPMHSLQCLNYSLHPYVYLSILSNDYDVHNLTLLDFISMNARRNQLSQNPITEFPVIDDIDKEIQRFSLNIEDTLKTDLTSWQNSLLPWDNLVEGIRQNFGDCWSSFLISAIAAGIKSKDEKYEEYSMLEDKNASLCKRVRCARLKSGNIKYWENQLKQSESLDFTLFIFFAWATPKTIVQILPLLASQVDSLSSENYRKISKSIKIVSGISKFNKAQVRWVENELKDSNASYLSKYLVTCRFPDESQEKFIYMYIEDYSEDFLDIVELKLEYLINKFLSSSSKDNSILEEIKKVYSKVKRYDSRYYYMRRHYYAKESIDVFPVEMARKIMEECKKYPRLISSLAEKSCRLYAHKELRPVGNIAQEEKWF